MIGGFELTVWPVGRIRFVREAAVGERATQAFVEEQEKERNLNAFGGEAIGLAAAIAFQ